MIKSDIGIFEENSYHAQNGEMRPFRAQDQQFLTFLEIYSMCFSEYVPDD